MSHRVLGDPWDGYLRELLVDPVEIYRALEASPRHPHAGDERLYTCKCVVVARRPLDPETATLRYLRVSYRLERGKYRVEKIEIEDRSET